MPTAPARRIRVPAGTHPAHEVAPEVVVGARW